jgi:glutathione synthase/RimK-type ligase-like ATP-grasp enzyme
MSSIKKNILFVTLSDNFFGQTRKPWVGIDTSIFINTLKKHEFDVKLYDTQKLYKNLQNIENENIFYSFSQKHNYRNYLLDLMYELKEKNRIIPNYELLKCHENKGYQEILKRKYNLIDLESKYYSSSSKIDTSSVDYPIVLKSIDGSNGNNVFLCKNESELISRLKNFSYIDLKTQFDLYRRKYLRKKKQFKLYPNYSNITDYYQYKDYISNDKQLILQEFVPNQIKDYRVIVMGNKLYSMERFNRENDFRASGSKKFKFNIDANEELFNKAKNVASTLDSPCLSMDFIFDERDNKYKLIEFQALHFGISAIVGNDKYYKYDNKWMIYENNKSFEEILAESLIDYLGV